MLGQKNDSMCLEESDRSNDCPARFPADQGGELLSMMLAELVQCMGSKPWAVPCELNFDE